MYKYFKLGPFRNVSSWESKGLPKEKISSYTTTSDFRCSPILHYGDNARMKLKFEGYPLKQNMANYRHGPIVNIYIVHRLTSTGNGGSYTLENSLFGAINLTKNSDTDKYKYSGYGLGFDSKGSYTHLDGGYGRNVIIFGASLGSSVHANNRANSVLVLGRDFIQGINGTTMYAEKMYLPNFTADNKIFCLSIHCNSNSCYLFVKGKK